MYHDLSLGVDGVDEHSRRELVSTALQLGYTSIAANHVHAGTMVDSDRCRIKPLNIGAVLAGAPGIVESVKFHQKLCGVPEGRPFRQYSRITVVVDDTVQAGALNSANPVLQTYEIVAVRPSNQKAFEQACTNPIVDLISLDLHQRLPFRMKAPSVKAAIQRGGYFEISYGQALLDTRARRELFASGQVLQALTKGRGIIVSSGAHEAMELRGPNDIINMATLFGLSVETAKAATTKNCESVILHGVARRKTYQAAILVEHVPKGLDEPLFAVPSAWDPLSIGLANGSSVNLSPILDSTSKKVAGVKSHDVLENDTHLKETNTSTKVETSKETELTVTSKFDVKEDFISMVTTSSEWTEVSKKGKKSKAKRLKGAAGFAVHNRDSKKQKMLG